MSRDGEAHITRKLTAILAADVVGFSRLVGVDEEGTLERLKAHRKHLIDPKIAEHQGRIVKTTGDGLLVEFASVVDAVRCAVEIQRAMAERNADLPPDRRIDFRIGINLGDVIVDGDDIFGDGVNVAARLEDLGRAWRHLRLAHRARSRAGQAELRLRGFGRPAGEEHHPAGSCHAGDPRYRQPDEDGPVGKDGPGADPGHTPPPLARRPCRPRGYGDRRHSGLAPKAVAGERSTARRCGPFLDRGPALRRFRR
jgi:hypothetical protein